MTQDDSIAGLQERIRAFSEERDWDQFHTPKNLILAVLAEMGELAEVILWKSDEEISAFLKSEGGKKQLSEEIADVCIYLIRLCQKSDIDLLLALQNKLKTNESKYPIDWAKGHSRKYTER